MPESPKVLLVDGNHLLSRILFLPVFATLAARDHRVTGGLFGFLKSLRKSLDDGFYTKCVVIWDNGHSARRISLDSNYKSSRRTSGTDDPDEIKKWEDFGEMFIDQLDLIRRYALPQLGVHQISMRGREGDDMLYLSRQLLLEERPSTQFLVVSEDEDFAMMISPSTSQYRPIKDCKITIDNFHAELGMLPSQYLLYKCLVGDGGDDVAGIAGVGPSTAIEIVNNVTCPENYELIDNWDWEEVESFSRNHRLARVQKVAGAIERVKLNYELLSLAKEEFNLEERQRVLQQLRQPVQLNLVNLIQLFQEMEFKSLLDNLAQWSLPFRRLA